MKLFLKNETVDPLNVTYIFNGTGDYYPSYVSKVMLSSDKIESRKTYDLFNIYDVFCSMKKRNKLMVAKLLSNGTVMTSSVIVDIDSSFFYALRTINYTSWNASKISCMEDGLAIFAGNKFISINSDLQVVA